MCCNKRIKIETKSSRRKTDSLNHNATPIRIHKNIGITILIVVYYFN